MLVTLWMQQPARSKRCPACLLRLKGSRDAMGADLHAGVLDAAPTGPLSCGLRPRCWDCAEHYQSSTEESHSCDRFSARLGCPPCSHSHATALRRTLPEPAPAPGTECAAGLSSTSSPL